MLLLAPVSPGSTGSSRGDVQEEGRAWVVLAQEGAPASVDVSFSSSSGKVLQPNSQNIPSSLDTVFVFSRVLACHFCPPPGPLRSEEVAPVSGTGPDAGSHGITEDQTEDDAKCPCGRLRRALCGQC